MNEEIDQEIPLEEFQDREQDPETPTEESVDEDGDSISFLDIHESEMDSPDSANLILWGLFWGIQSDTGALAVFWEFDQDYEGKSSKRELLNEEFLAVVPSDSAASEYFNPNSSPEVFRRNLLNYLMDESPISESIMEEFQRDFQSFLNHERVEWLFQLIEDGNKEAFKQWIESLMGIMLPATKHQYQMNAKFIDPEEWSGPDTVEATELDTHDQSQDPAESQTRTETQTLDIILLNNPEEGVEAEDLTTGMDVYFKIVGKGVDYLPDYLIDQESANPSSISLVGEIESMESSPDMSDDADADPEDYKKVTVKIEPGISGEGLIYKDDRIKVPTEDETDNDFQRDLLILSVIVMMIAIIVSLIFTV